MIINIQMLIIWLLMGAIFSIVSSLLRGENMFEFVGRIVFIELFNVVIFLILTYFELITTMQIKIM